MITCKNLSFSYDEEQDPALDKISLTIEKGSFVAIIGHNGSGKSTLARLINALYQPREGDVLVAGMNTKDPEKLLAIRKTAGMVFQNPDNQLVATIVEEDIAFGPENLGIPREEIGKRIDKVLSIVGMEDYRHRPPHMLSGGQKQRIAIAGILAMEPEIILFDESTSMLDPSGRKEVMETIKKLHEEGITVILITHFMEEVLEAERVLVMEQGKLVLDHTPAELFSHMDLLRSYNLKVPEIIELAMELKSAGKDIRFPIYSEEDLVRQLCP